MASQTEAQVQSEISTRIAILQELAKHAGVNASGNISNYIAREVTALAVIQGDYSRQSNVELAGFRSFLASAIESGFARRIFDPLLRNYAKVDGTIVETDGPSILRRLYLRFIATNLKVKSRGISYGSPSAGSNLGSGALKRLTVDAYGYNIESCHMEAKRAECVRDENTGAEVQEETFVVRGADAEPDMLKITGSSTAGDLKALSARQSLVTNPSFSLYTGGLTSLTELTGWTPGSGATTFTNLNLDQTNYYRGAGGLSDPTPTALKFLGNENVSQNFDINNIKVDLDVPLYIQIAYNRSVGAADGRLTLQVGNASIDVVLAAQTGWNLLIMTLDKRLFPRNFANLNDPVVKITWSGRTTGTLLVDDLIMCPMTQIDGIWHAVIGGATPFIGNNRDVFTWTDALAGADSILQQWFWKLYGGYLPHSSVGAETWADPSV